MQRLLFLFLTLSILLPIFVLYPEKSHKEASAPLPSRPQSIQTDPTNFTPDATYMADRQRLDALQHDAFLYMWENSHPVSGMVYEGLFHWAVNPVAVGGTGFGIAALISAVDRHWITREEALVRLTRICYFLRDKTARQELHGAFPHWLDGESGATIPFGDNDTGADLVETALLLQGLLLARQYFNGPGIEAELRAVITDIWHDIDWNHFTNGEENGLYWHWNADKGFAHGLKILGNNECLIAYVLALASPTHPISRKSYDYWTSGRGYQPKTVYGYTVEAALPHAGPLFLAQYSFIGLDPRRMADAYVEHGYFVRNTKHTLSNRGYCLFTAPAANRYSVSYWGLTASNTKQGYFANEPKKDRATVAPTAALSSLPYTPHYSLQVFEALHGEYKEKMWGQWGPYDAFSLRHQWYSNDYLAINQLPMVSMAENYRTELFWRLFMQDTDIRIGLHKAGIHEPTHAPGFPEAVRPLKWSTNKYIEDAYDIRRHPDTGQYHIPFWVTTQERVTLRLLDNEQNCVLEKEQNARLGRNILQFSQFAPTTQDIFTLILVTEKEEYSLPLRLL